MQYTYAFPFAKENGVAQKAVAFLKSCAGALSPYYRPIGPGLEQHLIAAGLLASGHGELSLVDSVALGWVYRHCHMPNDCSFVAKSLAISWHSDVRI